MAASSESLFNLVDQLQHLESTVTNLIFEMAFKLSSLTSSNIFVMVENNLGRKYAGKPNLCAEYASTGLKHLHNDIKVDFDPHSGLVKEYPSTRDIDLDDSDLENAFFRQDPNATRSTAVAAKKRRYSARDSLTASGEKRRRQANRSHNADVIAASPVGDTAFGRPEDAMHVAKFEHDDRNYDQNANDDDIMIEEFTLDNNAAVNGNLPDAGFKNAGNGHESHPYYAPEVNHHGAVMEAGGVSSDVDFYFKNNEKVAALRTMTFEVTGVEVNALAPAFKIMTSVLYDVAKMASGTSPTRDKRDPHARAHFDKHFDRIMSEFPQLRMLTDQGVKVKTAGFGSFVRSTMQKTFGKVLDKALHADAKGNDLAQRTPDGSQQRHHFPALNGPLPIPSFPHV